MNITEMLVTCYDGHEIVLAVDMTSEAAQTVLTKVDEDGQATVTSCVKHCDPPAFLSMVHMMQDLAVVVAS